MNINTERQLVRKEKSLSIRFFALSINMYLIFLLFSFIFFFWLGTIFAGLFLLSFLADINKLRKKGIYATQGMKPSDIVSMAYKYMKINRVFVIAALMGLILATLVLSQTILLSASYEQQAFDNFISDVDTTGFIFTGRVNSDMEFDEWTNYVKDFKSMLAENDLVFDHLTHSLSYGAPMVIGSEHISEPGKFIETYFVKLKEYTEEEYKFYSQFSSFNFDYNASETIAHVPYYFQVDKNGLVQHLKLNSSVEFVIGDSYLDDMNDEFNLTSTKLDHQFSISEAENDNFHSDNWSDYERLNLVLLLPKSQIDAIVKYYQDWQTDNKISYSGLEMEFATYVYLDLPNLSDADLDILINKLETVDRDLWLWLEGYSNQYGTWVSYHSPLASALWMYKFEIQNMNAILLFIASPLVTLALFLVYFSLSLVEQRKQRLLAIMRMRGSSKDQMRILLTEEVLLSAFMAVIVGMITSIPWTITALQIEENVPINFLQSVLVIPEMWYWKLPLIGIILALDLNLPNINKLVRITVDQGEDYIESKQPFWQRFYLDLILFSLSVIFFIGIRFISIDNVGFFIFIIISLTPIMLLIFFIGAPLVTARYFSQVISSSSEYLWRKFGGMFALSTRNMRKNRYSSSRLVSFLLLGMMLSYVAVIIPATLDNWNVEQVSYYNGADIYIDGISSSNSTVWQMLNVDGVDSYTEVVNAFINSRSSGVNRINVLGVDPQTFVKAAYWQDYYSKTDLVSMIRKLTNNHTILMQEGYASSIQKTIGENMSIEIPSGDTYDRYKFEIVDTFTYFPRLVSNLPSDYGNGFFDIWEGQIVVNSTAAKQLSHGQYKTAAYLKVKPGVNITSVATKLRDVLAFNSTYTVYDVESKLRNVSELPQQRIIYSFLRPMLWITTMASVIAVSYFTFITLAERKREIGVFRSMGMIKRQIFQVLVVESLTLLFVSILLGGIAGYISASNIFFFLQQIFGTGGFNAAPPVSLAVPWNIIGIFTGIMVGLTILAAAIPAQLTSNKQTGSILRME